VSGSLRVTTTSGFLPFAMPFGAPPGRPLREQGPKSANLQVALTAPAETRERPAG
jgi:hypothetical protein